jgi:thiol-disulfide isomerase/thioredoxin
VPPKRSSGDSYLWAIVLGATALVVLLAIFKGRTGVSALEGKAAPAVTLKLLEGDKQVALAAQRGRVVMLDFWATWCGPCRVSMPRVQQIHREYASRGVDAYAVNTDVGQPDRDIHVREFMMQHGLTLPVAIDGDDSKVQAAFGVSSLPTLVVLDRAGQVAFSDIGWRASTERELRAALDAAVARNTN